MFFFYEKFIHKLNLSKDAQIFYSLTSINKHYMIIIIIIFCVLIFDFFFIC